MKDRFNLTNLPLSFLDEFHAIEKDELKQAILDVVNLLYDDYNIKDVQEMYSTFSSICYEFYTMNLYNNPNDHSEFSRKLNEIVNTLLYCASQLESYKVRQFHQANHKHVKVVPPRR